MSLIIGLFVCNHIRPLENFYVCNKAHSLKQYLLFRAPHDMVLVTITEGRVYEGLQQKICVFAGGEMSKEDRVLGEVSIFPTSQFTDNLLASLKMVKRIGFWNINISEHLESLFQRCDFQRSISYTPQICWLSLPIHSTIQQVCCLLLSYAGVCGTGYVPEDNVIQPVQPGTMVLNSWYFYGIWSNRVQGGLENHHRWYLCCLIVCILLAMHFQGISNFMTHISCNQSFCPAMLGEVRIPQYHNSDSIPLQELVNFEYPEGNTCGTATHPLHYWNSGGFYFLFSTIAENNTVMDINMVLTPGFSLKVFPYMVWSINFIEYSLETFQTFTYINKDSVRIVSHHQMQHNPQYLITQHLSFLFVIFTIMSTSGQNNVPNATTPNSPFNSETLDYCLVGRLLSNKPIRFHTFKSRMATLWKPKEKVDITLMDSNRFMFQFFSYADMERIVQQGPWLFDNFPLVWSKISVGSDPYTMPLDIIECWVQAHNLPFGFMTEPMGILLGNHVGRLVKYDYENNYGNWRRYMRLRVAMKVHEPLVKCFEFILEGGQAVTVNFRYEKAGNFCYVCGLFGHTESSCSKRFEKGFVEGDQNWGPYLRAEYMGPVGDELANPWLHDNGRRGRQGGRARVPFAIVNDIHRVFGRVKIGRDANTRQLIFYKHAGPLYSSDEWMVVSIESIHNIPAAAQPVQTNVRMSQTVPVTDSEVQDPLLLEGDEERIARLIQEARLKNPVTEVLPSSPLGANSQLHSQHNVSQLAASLAQVMRMGVPLFADPQVNKDGVLSLKKPAGQKQLKRLRLEDSEEIAEATPTDANATDLNRIDSSDVLISDDVVMNESASAANPNVMAGPGHQARHAQ